VLVADDEPLTRWAVMRTLAPECFEVKQAGSREEACCLLASQRFQVVVLANQLGSECMHDVIDLLARDGRAQGLVILYNGDSPDQYAQAFPEAIVVPKPFALESLTSAIESFLEPSSEAC
jgi:DNA-binding NtrC family response regulator